MFSCFGGIFFLDLFLAFAVALQLFSKLTAKEATTGMVAIVTIEEETVKEEGYIAHFHVGDAFAPFDSFASKCVDSLQV